MAKKEQNIPEFANKSFEENLSELENIVSSLETENTSLEDALKLYQKGINISIYLNKILDNIQGKIEIFKQKTQNGEIISDPFYFDFSKIDNSGDNKKKNNSIKENENAKSIKANKKPKKVNIEKDDSTQPENQNSEQNSKKNSITDVPEFFQDDDEDSLF